MTKEEMVERIISKRRKDCISWVRLMQSAYPHSDQSELISRWFDENPLNCDRKHNAGVIKGGTYDAK